MCILLICILLEKIYSFDEYLEQIENWVLPYFVDDLNICKSTKPKETVKRYLEEVKDNQMFITSYDNHLKEPV